MVATGLAASPFVVLVAVSAASRYDADRERAELRATSRAELIATLVAEQDDATPPSRQRLEQLTRLGVTTPDNATVVYRDGRPVTRAGDPRAAPPPGDPEAARALARRSGVFEARGSDGIERVWGVVRVGEGPMTLAYGLPGDAVYGPARSGLRRDIALALLGVLLAVAAAFLLAGRITAPIRRLAARVGDDEDDENGDLGAIERTMLRQAGERRKLEDQLRQAQKMEAVGQLAGGVAHDFNNLLTVISGYGEVARRKIGDGPGAAELGEMERAAERASKLTGQLLAFARKQMLDPVLLDLSEVTRSLEPMLGRLIEENVNVAMLLDDDLPSVLADRAQVEQAIVNLAINARDAMPRGGTLTLETRLTELDEHYVAEHAGVEAGPYVCLVVTDTGTGIAPERLEHIFEPFFTTKPAGHGTGLGLATVHGIVRQSGGHVQVYSEPELGTTFKVYLPAQAATERPARPPGEDAPELLRGTETILVCEDDELVRGLVHLLLTEAGYTVHATALPHEALEVAMTPGERIDLLVTDVILPDMSGPDLANRLADSMPGLPTLFLSGYTFETVRDRGSLPPGSAFLEKPFDRPALLREVRALLRAPHR
jgi:signal transduction histidine kinase